MFKVNENFCLLKENYLFAEIANRVSAFSKANPDKKLVKLGIGDVTLPLAPAVISALHEATNEMAMSSGFKGYGPYEGYEFLREAIVKNEFIARNINISIDEIYVSDGAKSDMGNILDLFAADNIIAITDPVYPAYIDANVISNGGKNIVFLPCLAENGFAPMLPKQKVDIIYLCYPNNPTGSTLTRAELKQWVDYAIKNDSIILFDAAYEAYIQEEDVPHSIFEIEGAKNVAIEFRSFSKNAGFTGLRCGYVVIPNELSTKTAEGKTLKLGELWLRRQATRYNGNSYPIQKAAAAIYSPEGKEQTKQMVAFYMNNAKTIRESLIQLGFTIYGGINAPYIFLKTPNGMTSWEFFDVLINEAGVVGTPGAGFGSMGEGYLRLTAFGSAESTKEAINRIKTQLKL